MSLRYRHLSIAILTLTFFPSLALAATFPQQKTISGTVTQIVGNRILVKTSSAAVYDVETSQTQLVRRNGAPMTLGEILVGDKVQASGKVWSDNSMSAVVIKNISLYIHTSTFTGKVASINPSNFSFTIQSKAIGTQTIETTPLTIFKTNNQQTAFNGLILGTTITIKGSWERKNTRVLAQTASATVRLISIDVTGQLVAKIDSAFTVVGNNVLYGVDISKAKLLDSKGKIITAAQVPVGSQVRVQGKHIAEKTEITATSVKLK